MKVAPPEYTAALAIEWADKLGLLSREEWREILSPLSPQNEALRESYPEMIAFALEYRFRRRDPTRPTLKAHRAQFARLHRAALEMRAALLETWCSPDTLYVPSEKLAEAMSDPGRLLTFEDTHLLKYPSPRSEQILGLLDQMIELSNLVLSHDAVLAEIREEYVGMPVHQSAETTVLWETIFRIWEDATGHLGYSEGGPLHRFIEKIQLAAGGPPINPETLKKAVQRWKARKGASRGTGRRKKAP